MTYKKNFSKMGRKKVPKKKKKEIHMSPGERFKILSEWRNSWFKNDQT